MIMATEIMGHTLNEAQIELTYTGPLEQLRDALKQQNLNLQYSEGKYTLGLAATTASRSPQAGCQSNSQEFRAVPAVILLAVTTSDLRAVYLESLSLPRWGSGGDSAVRFRYYAAVLIRT